MSCTERNSKLLLPFRTSYLKSPCLRKKDDLVSIATKAQFFLEHGRLLKRHGPRGLARAFLGEAVH